MTLLHIQNEERNSQAEGLVSGTEDKVGCRGSDEQTESKPEQSEGKTSRQEWEHWKGLHESEDHLVDVTGVHSLGSVYVSPN